jgi:tripartite ATP-independent transporter DctP family solute receptor
MIKRRSVLAALVAGSILQMPTVGAAEFTAKLAYVAQTSNPFHKGMEIFAQKVAEKTSGKVEIKLFHSQQLGGERDYIEGLQLGSVEMAATSIGPLVAFEKQMGLFTLPFLFRSSEHLDAVLDGSIGKSIAERLSPKGIRVLGYTELGARYLMDSQRPIRTPDDMKGLKFRAIENPIHLATYRALGARAIPMARPEVYSALKQGVLDGLDNGLAFYQSMGDYEVAKYLTLGVQLFQTPGALMISERFFQRLPADLQQAVLAAASESVIEQRKIFRSADGEILAQLKGKGVVVTQADPKPFADAAKSVWETFAADVGGREQIDAASNTK